MLGLDERPQSSERERIVPLERYGLKVISLGLFIQPGQPVIWRGPMITKLLTQFLCEVEWGELDVLVLDLPPGTGDAQLTITQQAPLAGGVIVTTPQDVALLDVQRGITMFQQVERAGARRRREHELPRLQRLRRPGRDLRPRRRRPHGGRPADPLPRRDPAGAADPRGHGRGAPIVVDAPASPETDAFIAIARGVLDQLAQRGAIRLPTVH